MLTRWERLKLHWRYGGVWALLDLSAHWLARHRLLPWRVEWWICVQYEKRLLG